MDPKYWSKPVVVSGDGTAGNRTVASTREAVWVLSSRWPVSRGRHYMKARSVCDEVLDGRKPPSEARRAFVEAAKEAEMTVRDM